MKKALPIILNLTIFAVIAGNIVYMLFLGLFDLLLLPNGVDEDALVNAISAYETNDINNEEIGTLASVPINDYSREKFAIFKILDSYDISVVFIHRDKPNYLWYIGNLAGRDGVSFNWQSVTFDIILCAILIMVLIPNRNAVLHTINGIKNKTYSRISNSNLTTTEYVWYKLCKLCYCFSIIFLVRQFALLPFGFITKAKAIKPLSDEVLQILSQTGFDKLYVVSGGFVFTDAAGGKFLIASGIAAFILNLALLVLSYILCKTLVSSSIEEFRD